jgi:hypothetical protein
MSAQRKQPSLFEQTEPPQPVKAVACFGFLAGDVLVRP